MIPPPIKPIRELFQYTADLRETLYLTPETGSIPLGADLAPVPYSAALYWLKGLPVLSVLVGVPDVPMPEASAKGLSRKTVVTLDTHATTLEVWLMARACIFLGLGNRVVVTSTPASKEAARESYRASDYVNLAGSGLCPRCKVRLPWTRPCFPHGRPRTCPACKAMIVRQGETLYVK